MTPESPNHLILDACCVINLFASRRLAEILAVLGRPIAVAAHVANEEALYIYGGPPDNVRHIKEQIELKPLIEANLLTVASIAGEQEQETLVSLATVMDDGEAMTAALAIRRGWSIATDDGRAINYLQAH
jgi:predicted nucleic acid-binding protein